LIDMPRFRGSIAALVLVLAAAGAAPAAGQPSLLPAFAYGAAVLRQWIPPIRHGLGGGRWVLPEEAGMGALPPVRALGVGGEAVGAGDLTDQLSNALVERPNVKRIRARRTARECRGGTNGEARMRDDVPWLVEAAAAAPKI
jgi:hypothetical protein